MVCWIKIKDASDSDDKDSSLDVIAVNADADADARRNFGKNSSISTDADANTDAEGNNSSFFRTNDHQTDVEMCEIGRSRSRSIGNNDVVEDVTNIQYRMLQAKTKTKMILSVSVVEL